MGARFSTSANMDGVRVRLDALKATLPQALDIYADVLQNPAFAPKELERLKQEQLATILREQSDPNEMAMRVLPGLLYGQGHAYARPFSGSGSADSVERITRDNLLQHHQQWYRPNNATLVVVGDTTLAEVLPLLEKKFGGWKAGDVPRKEIASVPAPGKPLLYLMDKPGAGQSVIYAAQLAMPRSAPEALPLEVLNNVFGGTFSSRLNMNLREDKHWTYGAGAKPITAQELAAAQSYETLGLPGRFETAGQVAGAYASVLQYKLPEDYYNSFTSKVSSLTLEQANELARRTIVPGQLVWVVVGDMAKVEAGVRSLNIGEVRKIDAEGTLLP